TPANDLVTGEVLASSSIVAAQVNVAGAVAGTTYTLSAAGTTGLTLTATVGSNTVSQSVAVSAMTSSAASSQTLNFSTLGVSISLQGFDGTKGTVANIVADLTATANDTIVTNAVAAWPTAPSPGATGSGRRRRWCGWRCAPPCPTGRPPAWSPWSTTDTSPLRRRRTPSPP